MHNYLLFPNNIKFRNLLLLNIEATKMLNIEIAIATNSVITNWITKEETQDEGTPYLHNIKL